MKTWRAYAMGAVLALSASATFAQPPKPAYVTGSPTTGAIVKASGPQSVTTGDAGGDCSTAGTLTFTCTMLNGVSPGAFFHGTDAANLTGTLGLARLGSQSANQVLAGPTSGSAATSSFRALVGADLPNPSTSALGGTQSKTCAASNWLSAISTAGVPACSQPAASDVSGLGTFAAQNYATPPAIGGTTPAAGHFSSLQDTAISGSTQCVQADSSGNFSGAGAACGGGGGGGGLVLLETHTASTSSELDFTAWYSSSYKVYEIDVIDVIPTANNADIIFEVSTDGGSTYDTGGTSYQMDTFRWFATTATVSDYNPANSIGISGGFLTVSNTTTYGGVSSSFKMYNPGGGASYTRFIGSTNYRANSLSNMFGLIWNAEYRSSTAVNAFRIRAVISGTTTTLASGTVKIYGRQN